MLSVARIEDEKALTRLLPEWTALDASVFPRTPFTSPDWNMLWWQYLRRRRWFVRDELFVHCVRDERGQLIAVAPMMLTRRPGRLFCLFRELQFFGADPNITEMRGLVCRMEDQTRVIEALTTAFNTRPRRWDWIKWHGIPSETAAQQLIEQAGAVNWELPITDYFLQLPSDWESFRGGLSRNIKESLRKCYNSLKRDQHAWTFKVVTKPEDTASALQIFYALHADRAEVDTGVPHPDVFARPQSQAFLVDYCNGQAAQDRLRIFQMEIAGTVVATRIGFELGNELFLYYSGYNREWGRYSVMTTVVAETIRWAIDRGLKVVNLSSGTDISKTRWGPSSLSYMKGRQPAPGHGPRLGFNIYRSLQDLLRKMAR